MTPGRGRLCILTAAVLWSLGGPLAKAIALPGPTMACLRVLFAALVLVPLLRRRSVSYRPAMLGMVACFATMNVCYVTAITLTSAANAIFLQYTAPAWMFLASVLWLREPVDRKSLVSLCAAMAGILAIVVGGWERDALGIALALAAGATYGGVAVFLRVLRGENPVWLTVLNHAAGGLVLLPVILAVPAWSPLELSAGQFAALALFGAVQMAIPYVLFSRGLSVVSAQEAGVIALVEPVLNPVLTYLVVGEMPSGTTVLGGVIILAAILWRYVPGPTALSARDASPE